MKNPYLVLIGVGLLAATPVEGKSKQERAADAAEQPRDVIYVTADDLTNIDRRAALRRAVHVKARMVCRAASYSDELLRACISGTAAHAMAQLERVGARMASVPRNSGRIAVVIKTSPDE